MGSKRVVVGIFVLMAIAQLYVPAKMIWDSETILREGSEYKFKTAPVDPTDLFRGKYITLSYAETSYILPDTTNWKTGEQVYVGLTSDTEGYAKIRSVSKVKPEGDEDYIEATLRYVSQDGSNKVEVDYPFDRYYMEESKAYDAEVIYRNTQRDSSSTTYALVNVSKGGAVLHDVMIDGMSILELVQSYQADNIQ